MGNEWKEAKFGATNVGEEHGAIKPHRLQKKRAGLRPGYAPVRKSVGYDATLPNEVADADALVHPERALWRAVILQALTDAACESRKYEARLEREKARRWLLAAGEDFRTVCHHAGFEPSWLHRHVRRALAGGCQWRLKPAEGSIATNRR